LSATLAGVIISASPTFSNQGNITAGSGTASHELTMASTSGLLTIQIDGVSVSASGSTTLNTGATNFADAVNANTFLNEIGIRAIASTDGSGKVEFSSVNKFVAAVNDDATLNEKGLSAVLNTDGSISLGGNYVANAKMSLKDLGVFASGFNGGLVLASGNLGANGVAKSFTEANFKLTTGGSLKAETTAAKPASDIQIFTREGRQIAGNPMTAADAAVLLTPLNGFVSDAEYRADYLTAFDGVGYRGMTVNTFKSDGLNRLELGVSTLGSKRASAPLLAQAIETNKAMPKNNTNAQTITVAAANGVQRSVTIPAGVAADYVSDVLSADLSSLGIAVSAQTRAVLEVPTQTSGSVGFDLSGDNITPFSIVSSITKGDLSGVADAINYRSDDTGITATLTNDGKKLVLDHASGSDIFISNISAGSVGMDISILDGSYQPLSKVELNLNTAGAASTPTNITVGTGTATNELTMASTSGSLIIDIEGVNITAAGSTTLNTGVANFVTAVNANPTLSGYGIRAIASTDGSGKVELVSNTRSLTHNTRVSGQISFTSKSGFSLQSSLDLTKIDTAFPDQNMGGMVGRDFTIAGTSAHLTFASNGEIDGAATNVEGTKSQAPSASYRVVLNAVGGPFDVVVNSGETDEPTSERIASVVASKMRAQAPVPSITGAPIKPLPPIGSFSRFSLDGAEYVLERDSTGFKISGPEEGRLVLNTEKVYSGASSTNDEAGFLGQSITLSVTGGSVSGQAPTPKFDTNASLFGFGTGSTFTSGATVLSSVDPKVTHKAQSALQGRKFTLPSVGGSKTMNALVNGFNIGITLQSNMPTAMTNITAGTGPSYNILTADNTAATTSLSATILGISVPVTVAAAAGATTTSAEMDARSSALASAINARAGVGYDADGVSVSARPAATTIAISGTFSNTGNTHAGFDSAREVTVSSVSDESGVNFTITGTDMDGNTLTETIVGGTSNNTVATTGKFLTVSQVVSSARPAGNVSVGIKLVTATASTNGSGNVALRGDVVSLTTDETLGATQPATLSTPSAVIITTNEDLSTKTFTITGTDTNGATLTETIAGTSTGSTLTSGGLFATVTNVTLADRATGVLATSALSFNVGLAGTTTGIFSGLEDTTTGVSTAASRGSAGNLAINGTFSNAGNTAASFNDPREVTITSVSDESGVNFTVTGTDLDGNALVETIVGGAANSMVSTTGKFLAVSQVATSAATAGNVSVGANMTFLGSIPFKTGNILLSDGSVVGNVGGATSRTDVSTAASRGSAGNLVINGTLSNGGNTVASFTDPREVTIYSVSSESGVNFTITGTGADGNSLTEVIAGGAATSTVSTRGKFLTVSQVATSAATTGNVSVGAKAANLVTHVSGTTLKLAPTAASSSTSASISIEGVMVTVTDIQLANFVATAASPNGDTSIAADSLTKANNYASRFATAINENTELVAKGLTAVASINGSGEISVRRLATSLTPGSKPTSVHLQADLINGPIKMTGSVAATSLGFKVAEANLLVTDDGLTANSTEGQAVSISGTGSSLAESRLQLSGLPKEELIVVIAGGGARRISAEYTIVDTASVDPLKEENSYEVKMIDAASGRVELFDKATGHSIATRISNGNAQFDSDGIQFNLNGNSSTGDIFGVLTGQRSAGDARNFDVIMNLASTSVGRSSFQDDFRSIAAAVGSTLESSRLSKLSAEAVRDAAFAAEDEVSGVNMDEEAGKLISQQQAYQAAARILQTAKEMFDTLLRI
jgi:flagellar hook-associated protein FlgK